MADYKKLIEKYKPSQGTMECQDLLIKVSAIRPKVILEIGVHLGRSLALWNEAFSPEILIGVDTVHEGEVWDQLKRFDSGGQLEYLAPYDSGSIDTWDKIAGILQGRKVDFLFIDGDHRYAAAKHDYDVYANLVRHGGIVAIHDVTLEGEKWDNLVETKRLYEEITLDKQLIHSDGTGCGVIYV